MRFYPSNIKDTPPIQAKYNGWLRGLDTLVSATEIKPNELSSAVDIQLVEDGKIQCPRDGQAYFGSTSGSRVTGIFPFYKSDGTNQLLRMVGTTLQKYNTSSGAWDNVSGFAYTTGLNTQAITAYDNLYISNGTDNLTKYDGTSITSFTAILAPGAPTVTRTGTAGTYTFSYKITAVTAVGETEPSAAGSTTLNQATLDASNYMTVSWSAVTSATGYNVYGRKDGSWKFITYLEGNGSVSYVDKGTITPEDTMLVPDGNTTGGPKGKYISLFKDTIFITGDPSNPSRVYYSGGGDRITDFTVGSGGGFIDVSKNDGQVNTGMIVFRNVLLIFKSDSIYQFSFGTDGLPSLTQTSSSLGAISSRSIVAVENDVFFVSRRGVFALGNEAGLGFDVLRTNELSARIRPVFESISTTYLSNVAAIYGTKNNKNVVIFSYTPAGSTTNSKAIVYDRERLAWYEWTNITANCWVSYVDSAGATRVLYGDDSSGYTKEVLTGNDDFGTSIHGYFRIRAEEFKELERYKVLKDVDVILRNPSGNIKLTVIQDGVESVYSTNIGTVNPSINWGHYVLTRFLLAVSYGTGVSSQDENVLRTLRNLNITGRSFMLEFDNNSSASFTLLRCVLSARQKSMRYRDSSEIVQV